MLKRYRAVSGKRDGDARARAYRAWSSGVMSSSIIRYRGVIVHLARVSSLYHLPAPTTPRYLSLCLPLHTPVKLAAWQARPWRALITHEDIDRSKHSSWRKERHDERALRAFHAARARAHFSRTAAARACARRRGRVMACAAYRALFRVKKV